jgi:hypothetical protein
MSAVLSFFKANPQWNDDLHKILRKIPGYEAQLLPMRSQMLACCGAEKSKSGKVELVVVDTAKWDSLAATTATITSKIEAINHAVETLDGIFAEIEQAGISCPDKTLAGIVGVEISRRIPQYNKETGESTDDFGRPIKALHDEQALAWAQRAEAAMVGL